jgi:Na+/H+ antiporter NhaD/arsenite permease-like protein
VPPVLSAYLIFAGAYLVLAVGRLPGFRVDRTGAAIIGASLMLAANVLTVQEAYAAIDYDTIMLLFGMMIVVANLRLSGFFTLVSGWVVEHAHRPLPLLSGIVLVSGVFSAFFVNDTICLVLTPLVLEITGRLRRNPVPYLLAVAMAANIGSVATITGNPQNMLIGSYSHIPYRAFAAALAPVAAIGMALTVAVIALVYRSEFRIESKLELEHHPVRINRMLLIKSLAVSAGMIVFFFLGLPVPKVAVIAGALLLVTRRVKPEKVYRQIDWSLLVLFIGLFIIIAGLEKTPLPANLFAAASRYHLQRVAPLSIFAALLSNLVSNVPAVLVFKDFIPRLADAARAWLALAMSSTLAGNLTILGSVANLIVVERARGEVKISFREYCKAGVPLTVLTIAAGILLL